MWMPVRGMDLHATTTTAEEHHTGQNAHVRQMPRARIPIQATQVRMRMRRVDRTRHAHQRVQNPTTHHRRGHARMPKNSSRRTTRHAHTRLGNVRTRRPRIRRAKKNDAQAHAIRKHVAAHRPMHRRKCRQTSRHIHKMHVLHRLETQRRRLPLQS